MALAVVEGSVRIGDVNDRRRIGKLSKFKIKVNLSKYKLSKICN